MFRRQRPAPQGHPRHDGARGRQAAALLPVAPPQRRPAPAPSRVHNLIRPRLHGRSPDRSAPSLRRNQTVRHAVRSRCQEDEGVQMSAERSGENLI